MLPFTEALFLGILCNILVCLAVWMAFSAHTVIGKVVVIVPPIAAFVAAGFEHSIANMYFLPMGLLIKGCAAPEFWQAIGQTPDAYAGITMLGAARNLLAVTLGNVIGGGALVGIVYWFVYLRGR
jgi:formate transporter